MLCSSSLGNLSPSFHKLLFRSEAMPLRDLSSFFTKELKIRSSTLQIMPFAPTTKPIFCASSSNLWFSSKPPSSGLIASLRCFSSESNVISLGMKTFLCGYCLVGREGRSNGLQKIDQRLKPPERWPTFGILIGTRHDQNWFYRFIRPAMLDFICGLHP